MRRWAKKVAAFAAATVIAAVVAGLAGALAPRPLVSRAEAGLTTAVLVLTNPIHSDIAIPLTPDLRERFAFLAAEGVPVRHPDARWLIVGWGARTFYTETPTWADLKPWPVLRAFTSDASVMHIDVAGDIPEPHPEVIRLVVSEAGLDRLVAFTLASFRRSGGEIELLPAVSYGPTDRFFEANGRFNALVGCNTWTAAALRQAGLRTGAWNPLPQTLAWSLKLYN